jgi:peptidoglycan/LPS O-acetylase OafA/YrhL
MKRIALIDYARFIAAMAVVIYHYTLIGMSSGKVTTFEISEPLAAIARYGLFGVELFFMISGYVIFYSARNRKASEFAVSRALRLLPAYCIAIIFTAIVTYFWGEALFPISLKMVLVNFTLLQSLFHIPHVDGVYWTLLYEVIFYAAVFGLLLLGFGKKLDIIFIAWPWLMLAAQVAGVGPKHLLGGYYFYFASGALFALLKDKSSPLVMTSLTLSFVMSTLFSVNHYASIALVPSVLIISSFYLLFLFITYHKAGQVKLAQSALLGALTYPLYLVHSHVGYMIFRQFGSPENQFWLTCATIAAMLVVAYLMHRIVEVKFAHFWRTFFDNMVGKPLRLIEGLSSSKIAIAEDEPSMNMSKD